MESTLTKEELNFFQQELLTKKERLIREIHGQNAESNTENKTVGDLADMASELLEREFNLTLTEKEKEMLDEIDKALVRIANNTYGLCIDTKEPISKARLEAIPEASRTLKAQEQYERMKKKMASTREKFTFVQPNSSGGDN